MRGVDTINLCRLSRRKPFVRVEAPDALQQTLAPKHLVAPGNAAVEVVGHIKECSVTIGDARIKPEQLGINPAGGRLVRVYPRQQIDCCMCPHRPMPEKPATKPTM